MISIVVPTIKGREEYLRTCLSAYAAHTTTLYEVIVIRDCSTCGEAWVKGAEKAQGSHLHFTADDLRPHAGWFQAAQEVVGRGFLPAPRILNDDGTLQSCGGDNPPGWETEHPTGEEADFSRIPFFTRTQWDQIRPLVVEVLPTLQYYSDNILSVAGRKCGYRTGIHRDYLFSHSLAEPGRGAGMSWEDRMRLDYQKFMQWQASL